MRIAAPLLEDSHFADLDRSMDAMEGASGSGDLASMVEANRQFHFTIFKAAGKPRMVDMIRVLWQTTDSYRSLYYSDESARHRVDQEHRSIVAALRAGETDRAVRELDQHREHAVAALAKRLAD